MARIGYARVSTIDQDLDVSQVFGIFSTQRKGFRQLTAARRSKLRRRLAMKLWLVKRGRRRRSGEGAIIAHTAPDPPGRTFPFARIGTVVSSL